MKKVEGYQGIYKDEETGVIVDRNSGDRARYRIAKKQAIQSLDTEYELREIKEELGELASLKEEVKELKDLLREALGKIVS